MDHGLASCQVLGMQWLALARQENAAFRSLVQDYTRSCQQGSSPRESAFDAPGRVVHQEHMTIKLKRHLGPHQYQLVLLLKPILKWLQWRWNSS